MDENIVRILASYGCKYMADDNKEMIKEIEAYVKKREEQLHIPVVSQQSELLPTKKETEIEIERELNELRLNVKESYLKNTMLKGFELGFQKCFNWVKTR